MNRTSLLSVVASSLVASLVASGAGCGGTVKTVPPPAKVATKPAKKPIKKKKKPPEICIAQGEQSVIGMPAADGDLVQFCVADGNGASQCYSVELDTKKLDKLVAPPIPQAPTMTAPAARLQSTLTEVRVCVGDGDGKCTALKPRIKKGGENPLEAAANSKGTLVAMLIGDAEAGKGEAQVWSVAKKKKLAVIKYAKGDYRCGTAHVIDELVFISAGVCSGPAAHGALYSSKGKKLADVGGAGFGTYGTVPVEIGDHRWAFLSETGGVIAIHDSTTGKLEKTIDLLALWGAPAAGDGGDAPMGTGGNPGESVLLRGGPGRLLVISGSPHAGNIGLVDTDAGTVEVVANRACAASAPAAAEDRDDDSKPSADKADDGAGSADAGSGAGSDADPATDLD